MGKRMIWKTFHFHNSWEVSAIESAWGSSMKAFGPNRVFDITKGGGGCEIETNIPVSGLRTLFRHAGVRVDWRNGVVWDTERLADKPEDEFDRIDRERVMSRQD